MQVSRHLPLILAVLLLVAAIVMFFTMGDRAIPVLVLAIVNVVWRVLTLRWR